MSETMTIDLEAMSPVEIDRVFAEIAHRAAPSEERLDGARRQARRYASKGYAVPEYLGKTIEELTAKIAEIRADEAPYAAEFDRRGGWTRYYLVADGHLHRTTACSTCYATTRFGWLPELSGKTDDDAIAEYGERLCSVCFPDAPVVEKSAPAGREYCDGTVVTDSFVHRYNGLAARCTCGKEVKLTKYGAMRKHAAR